MSPVEVEFDLYSLTMAPDESVAIHLPVFKDGRFVEHATLEISISKSGEIHLYGTGNVPQVEPFPNNGVPF